MCSGSGDCIGCDGHGVIDDASGELVCQACHRTGQCHECGGAGLIEKDAP